MSSTGGPPPPDPAGPGLARRAMGGAMWQGLTYVLGKLFTLVATIILARILTPNDFGLVALALVFVTYMEVVADLGAAEALVYLPRERRTTDAALLGALVWSGLLVAVAMTTAPAVASFFGEPQVTSMFRVLSLSLLFGGVAQVPDALLRKEMRFRRLTAVILSETFTRGAISVALALAGLGPWAIIYGYLGGSVAWSVMAWVLVGERPNLRLWRLDRSAFRPLLSYGIPAAGNALLLGLIVNIDYLIVGQRLGSTDLGYYTIAFRIPQILILQVLWIPSAVAFPLYSLVREDRDRLRRGYLTGVRLQTAYGAAAGAGLAAAAPLLVPVVFGDQWTLSIVPLQALSLYAAARALGTGPVELCNGIGRPGLGAILSVVRLGILVPALVVSTRWGLEGVAWTHAGVTIGLALFTQVVAIRLLEIPVGRFGRTLVPALAGGAATAAGVLGVRLLLPGEDVLRLVLTGLGGGIAGLGALWLADRRFVRELVELLRSRPAAAPTEMPEGADPASRI